MVKGCSTRCAHCPSPTVRTSIKMLPTPCCNTKLSKYSISAPGCTWRQLYLSFYFLYYRPGQAGPKRLTFIWVVSLRAQACPICKIDPFCQHKIRTYVCSLSKTYILVSVLKMLFVRWVKGLSCLEPGTNNVCNKQTIIVQSWKYYKQ